MIRSNKERKIDGIIYSEASRLADKISDLCWSKDIRDSLYKRLKDNELDTPMNVAHREVLDKAITLL